VAPLGHVTGYVPPTYPKSGADEGLIRAALRGNFVFATLDGKDLDTMVAAFEEKKVGEGEAIITQGDVGDYFYVLKSGTVSFRVDGKNVGEAKKGDAFGELALLYSAPRAASVTAVTAVELFRVDQKTFRLILQNSGQESGKSKIELLKSVDYFKELDEADLIKMAKIMKLRPFKEGEYLCRKGDKAEGLYIVQYGKLKGTDIEMGGKKLADITCGPRENIGAMTLAKDEPLPGNLVAVSSGAAYVIEKGVFRKTMGNYQRLSTKFLERRILVRTSTSTVCRFPMRRSAANHPSCFTSGCYSSALENKFGLCTTFYAC